MMALKKGDYVEIKEWPGYMTRMLKDGKGIGRVVDTHREYDTVIRVEVLRGSIIFANVYGSDNICPFNRKELKKITEKEAGVKSI